MNTDIKYCERNKAMRKFYSRHMAEIYISMMILGSILYHNSNTVIQDIGIALSYPVPFIIVFITGFIEMIKDIRRYR